MTSTSHYNDTVNPFITCNDMWSNVLHNEHRVYIRQCGYKIWRAIYSHLSAKQQAKKKAVLSQAEPRDATVNFDTHRIFTARQHRYAERCISYSKSVRPSVCPSHAGTVSKRLKLRSWDLHWRI